MTLGIDLGTGAVRAALFHKTEVRLVQFPDGGFALPAAVSLDRESFRLGHAALARAATHPHQTVRGVKRLLGRFADDPMIERLQQSFPCPLIGDDSNRVRLLLGEQLVEPEAIAQRLLTGVLDAIEAAGGGRPDEAVLCAPAWFSARQRAALCEAARRANITTLEVLHEATAVALSLMDAATADGLVGIVDVGAGGCSASVVEIGPGRIRVLSSAGEPIGGGEDLDWHLVDAVLRGLDAHFGAFPHDATLTEMVRQVCEEAKRGLEQTSMVTAVIPYLPVAGGMTNQEVFLEREGVEALLAESLEVVSLVCDRALRGAGIDPTLLTTVFAVGGMAHLPMVSGAIERAVGRAVSHRADRADSVALGAAKHAAALTGLMEGVSVTDGPAPGTIAPPPKSERDGMIPPVSVRTMPAPITPQLEDAHGSAAPTELSPGPRVAADSPAEMQDFASSPAGGASEPSARGVVDALEQGESRGGTGLVVAALARWAMGRVNAHDIAAVLDLLDSVEGLYAARRSRGEANALRRQLDQALCTTEWLVAALSDLAPMARPPVRDVTAFSSALAAQAHDGFFGEAIRRIESVHSESLRVALLRYVERFVENHEDEIGRLVRTSEAEDALPLLAALRDVGTERAMDAAATALRSVHAVVRLQAVSLLGEESLSLAHAALTELIKDEDPQVRQEALSVIAARRLKVAGPVLAVRIRSKEFDDLPEWERKLLLQGLGAVSMRRAEALAIEILNQTGLFASEGVQRSRWIAAEFLGASDSAEALEALEEATRRRWVNPHAIRTIAARAATAVTKRRTLRPPPPRG